MVKLTPEIIEQSYQFTNAVRDRELDLRGICVVKLYYRSNHGILRSARRGCLGSTLLVCRVVARPDIELEI